MPAHWIISTTLILKITATIFRYKVGIHIVNLTTMTITRKNQSYSVECIKFCKNQDNVRIYLFKNMFPIAQLEYIVAVRKDDDTMYFSHFRTMYEAVSSYLENVCKYA